MNRTEYAEKVRQEAICMVELVVEEAISSLSANSIMGGVIDKVKTDAIDHILGLDEDELMRDRHQICSIDSFGDVLKKEIISRLL